MTNLFLEDCFKYPIIVEPMSFLETNVGISKTTLSACFLVDFILFPFTPFKEFTGRPVNEIHLYSTTLANAIVYFVTSKLNSIYEQLPPQAVNEERVELRHFTIIDEAHYMLGFENKPLQHLKHWKKIKVTHLI